MLGGSGKVEEKMGRSLHRPLHEGPLPCLALPGFLIRSWKAKALAVAAMHKYISGYTGYGMLWYDRAWWTTDTMSGELKAWAQALSAHVGPAQAAAPLLSTRPSKGREGKKKKGGRETLSKHWEAVPGQFVLGHTQAVHILVILNQ